jgi:hypothetical protein
VREGRAHYRIAFDADPDGNVIELMEIRQDSAIYHNPDNSLAH